MRLLIVAEHTFVAEMIRRELKPASELTVIGWVAGLQPCGLVVRDAQPDVVVIDDLGEATAARTREVRSAVPGAKLILLTARMDPSWLTELADAGIDAAVAKSERPGRMNAMVREIARGAVFHAFAASTPTAEAAAEPTLTARELEIVMLMAAGASNARIAAELWVTEQTVKFHLSNVYRKLGVANRTQASHYAHTHGLLEPRVAARAA